jgi:hypothetical protein
VTSASGRAVGGDLVVAAASAERAVIGTTVRRVSRPQLKPAETPCFGKCHGPVRSVVRAEPQLNHHGLWMGPTVGTNTPKTVDGAQEPIETDVVVVHRAGG